MDFLRPAGWEEALAVKAEHPTAVPIAGGTDIMVEINFDIGSAAPAPIRAKAAEEFPSGAAQIQGGTTRGPGAAVMEKIIVDPKTAKVRNPSFPARSIPTILDTPATPVDVLELTRTPVRPEHLTGNGV